VDKKANKMLKRNFADRSKETSVMALDLYKSLVRPHLEYSKCGSVAEWLACWSQVTQVVVF